MRRPILLTTIAIPLALAACSRGDRQAAALDNAANQADPAAAAVMRDQAEAIRANGSEANLSAPGSPVQDAMSDAGAAAAASNGAAAAPAPAVDNAPGAKPHRAGEAMPPAQAR